VNENVGGVDPGRRGIQQICSLMSGLAWSNGSKEGEKNLDDITKEFTQRIPQGVSWNRLSGVSKTHLTV